MFIVARDALGGEGLQNGFPLTDGGNDKWGEAGMTGEGSGNDKKGQA